MTNWRDRLVQLPLDHRIKAVLAFELASDRACGEPVEVTARTLRAVACAEGLDTSEPWIEAAALDIARCRPDRPALSDQLVDQAAGVEQSSESTRKQQFHGGDSRETGGRSR